MWTDTCSLLFAAIILQCQTLGLPTLRAESVATFEHDDDLPLLPQAARQVSMQQGTAGPPNLEQEASTSFAQVHGHDAAPRQLRGFQEQAPRSALKSRSLSQALVDGNETNVAKEEPAHSKAVDSVPISQNQKAMQALYDSILGPKSTYNKKIRPLPDCSVYDCSHRISAQLGIGFTKMLGIDEKKNQIKMLGIMTIKWPDYRLDYDAVKHMPSSMKWNSMTDWMAVDAGLVWMPDVQLVNAAEPLVKSFSPRAYLFDEVKRKKDGYNVVYAVPISMTVKCKLVYDNFPFDAHTCPFFFRSWSASNEWINLQGMENPPLTWHSPDWENVEALSDRNEEFDLKSINMTTALVSSGEQDEHGDDLNAGKPFAEVVYAVHVERFSHYYMCVIVLPMALVIVFSLGVFFIDPERGERLGVSMTLLLTVMAMSFFTADSIPKSGGGDTWMQIFQSYAYVLTMIPLLESMCLELCRRLWIQHRKSLTLRAGHEFDEDDEDVDWIDFRADHILRPPYAVAVVSFMVWVFWKYLVTCQQREVSVEVMLGFLCTCCLGMLILPIIEIWISIKGGHDWHNMKKLEKVLKEPGPNSSSNLSDSAAR